jgi:hypothetical protein
MTVRDLIEEVARGGWPGLRALAVADAAQAVRDYLGQISRTDISTVDGVRRDPARVLTVLRSLARHTATQATLKSLAEDSDVPEAGVASYETVSSYLVALERLMIVENVPAWNTHLRSCARAINCARARRGTSSIRRSLSRRCARPRTRCSLI